MIEGGMEGGIYMERKRQVRENNHNSEYLKHP